MPELESVKHEEIGVNSKGMSSCFWDLWSVVDFDVVTYYHQSIWFQRDSTQEAVKHTQALNLYSEPGWTCVLILALNVG